jgi:hypothetical protein
MNVMDNARMPLVAVIGGFWQAGTAQATDAKNAARQIGAELAKNGFGLVVYFSDEESLEPHVVTGYVPALPPGAGKVRVRYPESQRGKVKFKEEASRPEIFEHRLFPGTDWEAPFYRSLAEQEGVDAVLLMAGSTSTLIAGQIAVARRLPILAVDEFGGSAAKIWNQLAQIEPEKHQSWGTSSPAKLVQRLKEECVALEVQHREARRREALLTQMTARRRQGLYAAGAFICLLAVLFFGIAHTPSTAAYPYLMFIGLIAAGATGGLVRAVISASGENDPNTSLLLGGIAGFIVGVAYLIPQWVGAPGVLEAHAAGVSATDKIQFASAVLVAISAGVGFDTVFNRLQKRAEDVSVTPPK